MPAYIGVVGASEAGAQQLAHAVDVGRRIAEAEAILVCGGRGGVMEAACRGASNAGGITIGILPGTDRREANEWVQIAIPTGLGELRNGLIVRSADVLIAIAGGYGTLSEVALALRAGTPVIGLGTWEIEGIETAASPDEAVRAALARAA
jgi:uncharacterized protein (TIGR00725 family)